MSRRQGSRGSDNANGDDTAAVNVDLSREPQTLPPLMHPHPRPIQTSDLRDNILTPQSHVQPPPPLQTIPKTRRRRGSLRKVALLGRGAQRERREALASPAGVTAAALSRAAAEADPYAGGSGLGISNATLAMPATDTRPGLTPKASSASSSSSSLLLPRHVSLDGYNGYGDVDDDGNDDDDDDEETLMAPGSLRRRSTASTGGGGSLTGSVTADSITDDEDALHMAHGSGSTHGSGILSTAASAAASILRLESQSRQLRKEGQTGPQGSSLAQHKSKPLPKQSSQLLSLPLPLPAKQRAKSPLSLTDLASPLPVSADPGWDYAETEWWGWVMLVVTWVVFVIGMGSCLDVWSWAWDVGKTPYAPPELEDDPTLPIVGYYPALLILTSVMAWVWVFIAWIGMKYFRHAKISGD